MQVNIVTNFQILQEIKKSKYFQVNLGFVPTVEKNGQRVFNDQDKFSQVYNGNYKTTIYAQGKIGNIRFYTDHYIQEPVMGIYYGDTFEEFVVDFDNKLLREKGIDGYLGYIIKGVEEQYDELLKENALKKIEEKPKGDAEKLVSNPGSVTWDDVKAFLEKERSNRRI
jgi:hypothetical protein